MDFESKLIPVLRDGVNIIKMILFKELKENLPSRYPDRDAKYASMLSGAVINELFGTPNTTGPFVAFITENQQMIENEINNLAHAFPELRIPLTDALRVQFLCDSQEGINSDHVLKSALKFGVLMVEREVPLPKTFLNLVKKLGVAYHIIDPETIVPE